MRLLIDNAKNTQQYEQTRRSIIKEGKWLQQVEQVVQEVFDE